MIIAYRPPGRSLRFVVAAWRRVRSPNVGTLNNELAGVAASSARNIWAVGLFFDGSTDRALALHCC